MSQPRKLVLAKKTKTATTFCAEYVFHALAVSLFRFSPLTSDTRAESHSHSAWIEGWHDVGRQWRAEREVVTLSHQRRAVMRISSFGNPNSTSCFNEVAYVDYPFSCVSHVSARMLEYLKLHQTA